jgi:hypothetical protein
MRDSNISRRLSQRQPQFLAFQHHTGASCRRWRLLKTSQSSRSDWSYWLTMRFQNFKRPARHVVVEYADH